MVLPAFAIIAALLTLGLPKAGWALFTGNDQYDRNRLNTEKNLDSEYFLNLLAYRPFWEPAPGDPEPMAFIRNTEGSLNTNELYVRRGVRVRGRVSDRGFFGYGLRQLDDLEQNFFYQFFEGQGRVVGPFSFRFYGAPSAQKEDSDIGMGGVFDWGGTSTTLNWTWVDFVFNGKNDRRQFDRKDPINLQAQLTTRAIDGWGIGFYFDLDTPVEREFQDDDQVFTHHGLQTELRAVGRTADIELFWRRERRTTGALAAGDILQDYRKEVIRIHPAWLHKIGGIPGRMGVEVQRRRAEFVNRTTASETENRQRWEFDPYVTGDIPLTKKWTLELGLYAAFVWEKRVFPSGPVYHDRVEEGKLKTAFRIDFSPSAGLVLSPTWDLKQFGTRRTFGGGNVQFRTEF